MPLEYVRLTPAAGDQDDIATALTQFDCCRDVTDDPVADEVNSTGERERLGLTHFPEFGALRLVMLGVDSDCQGQGHGDALLKWTVGKGRAIATEVAFRFVLADVNLRRKDWYDKRQFQVNRAAIYKPDEPNRSTISMRLDLHAV